MVVVVVAEAVVVVTAVSVVVVVGVAVMAAVVVLVMVDSGLLSGQEVCEDRFRGRAEGCPG